MIAALWEDVFDAEVIEEEEQTSSVLAENRLLATTTSGDFSQRATDKL